MALTLYSKQIYKCDISGFYGSEHESDSFVGSSGAYSCWSRPMINRPDDGGSTHLYFSLYVGLPQRDYHKSEISFKIWNYISLFFVFILYKK
jgi:hypothetical protein